MTTFGEATSRREGARVWVGDYGNYDIPKSLWSVRISARTGYPDKRYRADYARFMSWVAEQEQKAQRR